jgi:REP element-mobilizing transposase RayT
MSLPPVGYQALRKGRVSEAGRLYFITKTLRDRLPKDTPAPQQLAQGRLVQPGVPEILLGSLDWLQQHNLVGLMAYCVMPDHLHVLFQLRAQAMLDNVMQRFGSFTGLQVYRHTGQGGLWGPAFYDHALRAETPIAHVVDYIEYNPVRAGLVLTPLDWPWSSVHLRRDEQEG